jgi:orotate phosphoribosyltransferase
MEAALLELLAAREGHFRYESGYHARLWLDLDPLFLHPARLTPFIEQLARQCATYQPDAFCGPLTGGAFVALRAAEALGVAFYPTERRVNTLRDGLYPVAYPLPASLRHRVAGQRVVILDDVMSAGSAVRGSLLSLHDAGAHVAAVGALLVLGDTGAAFFEGRGLPVEAIARRPNPVWRPDDCPLCAAGMPLEDYTPEGSGPV